MTPMIITMATTTRAPITSPTITPAIESPSTFSSAATSGFVVVTTDITAETKTKTEYQLLLHLKT